MVTVPLYGGDNVSQVKLGPEYTERVNVNVNADMFGASIGRGLQNLGAGLNRASDAMLAVQQERDRADARRATAEVDKQYRDIMLNPDTGLLNTQGSNARGIYKIADARMDEVRKKFSSSLTGQARELFLEATDKAKFDYVTRAMGHEAAETKRDADQSFVSAVDTAGEAAVAFVGDEDMIQKKIGEGLQAIDERSQLNGWNKDTRENLRLQFTSDTRKKIVYRMATTDAVAANEYYKKHKDEFTGDAQADIEKALQEPMAAKQAADDAAAFWGGKWKNKPDGNTLENAGASAAEPAVREPGDRGTPAAPAGPVSQSGIPPEGVAFLNAMASTESPGYNVIYGGQRFSDYSDHPRVGVVIKSGDYRGRISTAAGRYQFIGKTWDRAAAALGLKDFSPENQDKAAWWLAQEDYRNNTGRDLVADLKAGNYALVRRGLGSTWEGLTKINDENWAGRMQKAGGTLPSSNLGIMDNPTANVEAYLQTLPAERRDAARKQITAQIELMNKQQNAQRDAAKQDLWSVVLRGGNVDDVPIETREAAGLDAVVSARNYVEKSGEIQTDQELKYNLDQMKGTDPQQFSSVNLLDFRDKLSKSDFDELSKAQSAIKGDNREAREKELDISAAQRQAETQLEAAGIMKPLPSSSDEDKQAYAQRVNTFNAELAAEMRRFQQVNGKPPSQIDIQQMTSKLLMPIVLDRPEMFKGYLGSNDVKGFAFERGTGVFAGQRATPDYATIMTQIEPSMQSAIAADLKNELGRQPTPDEIAKRYVYLVSIFNTVDASSPKDQNR